MESEIWKKMADFDGVLLSIDTSCKMEGTFPILLKLSLSACRCGPVWAGPRPLYAPLVPDRGCDGMCLLIGRWDVSPDWTTTAASSVPAGTLQAKDGGCTGRYFTMGIRPPLFPGLRRTRKSGSAYNLISEISPRMLHTQPRWLPSASRASSEVMTKSRDT